jgi:hypothetical protein
MIIPDSVRHRILQRLSELQSAHAIRILYAVETGSRAWGFASVNSDYDVRFIYAHPRDWYLTLKERRDVLETPIVNDLDVQGWDVRKALRLFARSNPPLNEWLVSPHVYLEQGLFAPRLRQHAEQYYSPKSVAYHYLHTAKHEYHSDFYKGDQVILKKYLYIVRPLLNILWLRERRTIPPISMIEILNGVAIESSVRAAIDRIVEQKRAGMELGRGAKIPVLDRFLEELFIQAEEFCAHAPVRKASIQAPDQLFRDVLDEEHDPT